MSFDRTPTLVRRFAAAVESEYRRRRTSVGYRMGDRAPAEWNLWLTTLFPQHFNRPLGQRHREFWRWVLSVKAGERPRPFVGIWPRGSGKSSSAEGAVVALGARGRRKYGLYVCATQDQADKHVEAIASMFESDGVRKYYPSHAERKVGKFGNSRGWRRNRVWTAGGFAIDALGLDTASRGLKLDFQRPDVIILDDVDGKFDSLATTAKKLETITHTILPAGSPDVAVLAIQNLISRSGVFTQLADGTADFLVDRIISGPFPAVEGLEWEWRRHPDSGIKYAAITGGTATWEGQDLNACQDQITTFGIQSFVAECQHDVKSKALGVVLRMKPSNMVDLSDDECRDLFKLGTGFGGIDFQAARFAFVLFAIDRSKRPIRIDEYFSQFEGLKARAQVIHELCEYYGVSKLPIWGDAANPQDIMEINSHFRDGWDVRSDDGKVTRVTSKLRCAAVAGENKLRKVAVERMNDALDRDVLLFRTGIEYDWMLGRTSDSEGTPQHSSRLLWEAEHWSYPKTLPGKALDENPDDHTADGADCMAGTRYALMSHWKGAKLPRDYGTVDVDRAEQFDYKKRQFREAPHAVDLLQEPSVRRAPRVSMPRPRIGR